MAEQECVQAWGDESVRMSLPRPAYLLAASWFKPGEASDLQRLDAIKPHGAAKLHWMDMNAQLKRRSIAAIAQEPMLHAVVVACELAGRKQERARRKCLEVLLPFLEQGGIALLTLESRGRLNDNRDVDMLLALRRSGAIEHIDIRHRKGSEDRALWVPDQVLGAYAENELEKDGAHAKSDEWARLEAMIRTLWVEL